MLYQKRWEKGDLIVLRVISRIQGSVVSGTPIIRSRLICKIFPLDFKAHRLHTATLGAYWYSEADLGLSSSQLETRLRIACRVHSPGELLQ